jgi:hypothetical protein
MGTPASSAAQAQALQLQMLQLHLLPFSQQMRRLQQPRQLRPPNLVQ